MMIFIFSYIILTLPLVILSNISVEKRAVQLLNMMVVFILGYLKIQHDNKVSGLYEELTKSKENILDNAKESFALHEMIFDENNNPVDYRFVSVNPAFEKYTGL